MKKDNVVIISLIIILIFLFLNIISTIFTFIDYEKGKESGNERWKQVENRILQTEEKMKKLEEEIELWRN